ncbi:hypothetical protein LguiB_031449 [Lonicera macranthoides]
MSRRAESAAGEEEEEEEEQQNQLPPPPYHPSAPSDALFDISTTVDPSYVISLIRKLLPSGISSSIRSHGVDVCDSSDQGSKGEGTEESVLPASENGTSNSSNGEYEAMDTVQHEGASVGEEAWEEYGCILWDLASSRTHAELMLHSRIPVVISSRNCEGGVKMIEITVARGSQVVRKTDTSVWVKYLCWTRVGHGLDMACWTYLVQNLVLEVLLASLMVSQSARVTEIGLGIIGNLACHEVSRKHIASTKGLVEVIVDQLFLDDTPCLCEACRLLTLCLQGSEGVTWAEALQHAHVLSRVLWIAENTLSTQLIERCVGLLLAVLESQQEVSAVLLPCLVKLGLPTLLINLLAFEMSKLTGERVPERYSVLDLILRTVEALSVIDGYSQELCSNKSLFQLLKDLVKLPDKIEFANSCVTAAVLTANILTDAADLALEISHDLLYLQGLFDIYPFASDDIEACSALWSIVASLLVQVEENEMSPSTLHQYVSILVSKSDLIQEELIDHQLDGSTTLSAKLSARTTALKRIFGILTHWRDLNDHIKGSSFMVENHVNEEDVNRLLDCCRKYTK